jgi:hypothetical protein
MLSHRQNSRALSGRRCPGSGEAQRRQRLNFVKILPVVVHKKILPLVTYEYETWTLSLREECNIQEILGVIINLLPSFNMTRTA